MSSPSFHLKLHLLHTLKSGNINQIQTLIEQIKTVTKINPELYEKFSKFITDNKNGLIQMERLESQQNTSPKTLIQHIDGEIKSEDQNSDSSWSSNSSDQQPQTNYQHKSQYQPPPLKQINNKLNNKILNGNGNGNEQKKIIDKANPKLAFKKHAIKNNSVAGNQGSKITTNKKN